MNPSWPVSLRYGVRLCRCLLSVATLAVLLTAALPAGGAEPDRIYRVGITAFRDKSVTVREWQPTMDFRRPRFPARALSRCR